MSEPSKIGLLVCPRCQNLLPHQSGYPVLLCRNCGHLLRVNNNNDEAHVSTDKLNDGSVQGSYKLEKFDSSYKQTMNLSDGFESDVISNSGSRTRSNKKELLSNKLALENDPELKSYNVNEMGNFQIPKEFDDWRTRNGDPNLNGSRRTVRKFDWRTTERSDMAQFQNTQMIRIENMSMYSEDGPSNYPNRSNEVEYLEQDRAELLMKLDVLNKQIQKSNDLGDRPKEMFHQERRVVHQDPYGGSMEHSILDRSSSRPLYMDNSHQMASSSSRVVGYGDPFRSQMPSRIPPQPQSNSYFGMDTGIPNMDRFARYPNNMNLHHPSCSCFHCRNEHQRTLKRFSAIPNNQTFYNQENPNPNMSGTHRYDTRLANPPPSSTHNANSHTGWLSASNSEFETSGISGHRPRRSPPPAAANRRRCCPVAGGAPFITCFNCLELLQLPKKSVSRVNKNQKKMKCSNCSSIILYTITNNKLVVSNHLEEEKSEKKSEVAMKVENSSTNTKWASTDFSCEDYDNSAYDFQSMDMKVASPSTNMRTLHTTSSPDSENEDSSSNLIARKKRSGSLEPPITEKPPPPPKGSALQDHLDYSTKYNPLRTLHHQMDMKVASPSTNMRTLHTTPSPDSEFEDSSSNLIARKKGSGSLEPPITEKPPPPPKGSALQDHLDYSTKYNPLNHVAIGIQSKINEENAHNQLKEDLNHKSIGSQSKINEENAHNPIKDDLNHKSFGSQSKINEENAHNPMKEDLGTNATEIEISANDFYSTGTSQDSGERSRGEDQMRIRRGRESHYGGNNKQSFKDNVKPKPIIEEKMSNVTVNGHLILDRLVKKAEKLAGPIQPGEYWYDFRAGFWGVMGGPCLGIIPPFIEEFNYPMRENCAGGNTRILVNGRELTDKDLDLLGSRGLPTEENRSYILEISGRILDVDSGEELVTLGKLAPTIEKMKRGFGMKIPRSARIA